MKNTPLSARRGNTAGIKFFYWFLKIFGLNRPCEFVWAVCIYYILFDREAVKSAMPYVRHRFPDAGFLRRMWYVYKIFVNHGQAMLICAAGASSDKVSMVFENRDRAKKYLQENSRGLIIITSHFGAWQTAMSQLQHDLDCPISFLMHPEQNHAVHQALQHNPTLDKTKVIATTGAMGGVLEVMEEINAGNAVCMMADRAVNDSTSAVDFLGETAHFPYSAFFLGAKFNCPVLPLFVAKDRKRHDLLRVSFGDFIYPEMSKNKKNIIGEYVQKYVNELEDKVRQYPFQCYLFQDVWSVGDK